MKIAVGCDHGGYTLLEPVVAHLKERGFDVDTFGSLDGSRTDYPDVATLVAERVVAGDYDCGILMCGTGIGISIAANKVKGARCANVADAYSAAKAREHNNANLIALGGRTIGDELALTLVDAYLDATFEGGRHATRVAKIGQYEDHHAAR
ncbi:MAG: ribose 5-phosphate isomerase B [Peptoniphilaceae bacterium]|nr:ribose 5-phosphate isomerase B [Peptoniphilaceae bacterium]MDY6085813.1 ribose 5-phosphate isomerase B [Peptoniphilaceae bacterium]